MPVSVVVVSRGRPDSLCLCLSGLSRLFYPAYEIIVVADPDGIAAARQLEFAGDLRLIPFDQANIAAARNMGICAAGGEVVAFIDDDAVPEPTWLDHLIAPFATPEVMATGGFVIGRNGISWQWKARWVNPGGQAAPLDVDETAPSILRPSPGRAIKTEGTNMAVRRWVLKKLNGFDEDFRFYMDETDLNMRLAAMGYDTAIVPDAVVHHAYAPSPRRQRNRAVLDLVDVGRSSVLFWRKHATPQDWPHYETHLRQEQRKRVITQMRDGLLETGAARAALRSLERGLHEGRSAPLSVPTQISRRDAGFHRFPTRATGQGRALVTRPLGLSATLQKANDLADQGHTVSVFCFSATAAFHSVRYLAPGIWLQRGGLWGKSARRQPLFRLWRRKTRLRQEQCRVAAYRGVIKN